MTLADAHRRKSCAPSSSPTGYTLKGEISMSSLETVSPGNGSGTIYTCDIPAERPWSRVLKRGQTWRIVDSEGQQAADALLYCADTPPERYTAQYTLRPQRPPY